MALTHAEYSAQFQTILDNYLDGVITVEQFRTQLAQLLTDWTSGGITTPDLILQLNNTIALWYQNQLQENQRMNGTADFVSDDPDQPEPGWYPVTTYLGQKKWLPSGERMKQMAQGFRLVGQLADPGQLPADAPERDAYVIGSPGNLWIKSVGGWVNNGPFTSLPGPQGPQGVVGPKGDKGDVGPAGPQGVQGIPGPKGDKGDKGDQGNVGPQGPVGASFDPDYIGPLAGRAAYDAAPENTSYLATDQNPNLLYFRTGAAGNWTAGAPFGQGPQGIQGEPGPAGAAGPQGPKGDPGEQGPQGPQGPPGEANAAVTVLSLDPLEVDNTDRLDELTIPLPATWPLLRKPRVEVNGLGQSPSSIVFDNVARTITVGGLDTTADAPVDEITVWPS